jgi:hypothetical protein
MSDACHLRGYTIALLTDCDLSAVIEALDDERVTRWIGDLSISYPRRAARDQTATSLTLVFFDSDGAAGTVGLFDYPDSSGRLQTATILAPRLHGSGLNALAKAVQWQLGLLAGRELVASIDLANGRSRAAMRKFFPEVPTQEVEEPWMPRYAELFELVCPPTGVRPLNASEQTVLRNLVAETPLMTGAESPVRSRPRL